MHSSIVSCPPPPSGDPSVLRSIAIGGCSRSGTTALGASLGGHPHATCPPEAQFIFELVHAASRGPGDVPTITTERASTVLAASRRFHLWDLSVGPIMETFQGRSSVAVRDVIDAAVAHYAFSHQTPGTSFLYWVNHTPSCLKYARLLQDIARSEKFIHIVRDPRDVVASQLSVRWGPATAYGASRRWMEDLAAGVAAESYLGREGCLRVRYEDLVASPSITMQAICSFLGWSYHPLMIEGVAHVPAYTRQQHLRVGRGLDTASIGRWRDRLSRRDAEIVEAVVGDTLEYLGYEPETEAPHRPVRSVETVSSALKDLIAVQAIARIDSWWRFYRHGVTR